MYSKKESSSLLILKSDKMSQYMEAEVYEMIFQDLSDVPEYFWHEEQFASENIDHLDQMNRMLDFFSGEEMYEKCIVVKRWIDALELTYSVVNAKNILNNHA